MDSGFRNLPSPSAFFSACLSPITSQQVHDGDEDGAEFILTNNITSPAKATNPHSHRHPKQPSAFTFENVEKILNCVPLVVDPRSPKTRARDIDADSNTIPSSPNSPHPGGLLAHVNNGNNKLGSINDLASSVPPLSITNSNSNTAANFFPPTNPALMRNRIPSSHDESERNNNGGIGGSATPVVSRTTADAIAAAMDVAAAFAEGRPMSDIPKTDISESIIGNHDNVSDSQLLMDHAVVPQQLEDVLGGLWQMASEESRDDDKYDEYRYEEEDEDDVMMMRSMSGSVRDVGIMDSAVNDFVKNTSLSANDMISAGRAKINQFISEMDLGVHSHIDDEVQREGNDHDNDEVFDAHDDVNVGGREEDAGSENVLEEFANMMMSPRSLADNDKYMLDGNDDNDDNNHDDSDEYGNDYPPEKSMYRNAARINANDYIMEEDGVVEEEEDEEGYYDEREQQVYEQEMLYAGEDEEPKQELTNEEVNRHFDNIISSFELSLDHHVAKGRNRMQDLIHDEHVTSSEDHRVLTTTTNTTTTTPRGSGGKMDAYSKIRDYQHQKQLRQRQHSPAAAAAKKFNPDEMNVNRLEQENHDDDDASRSSYSSNTSFFFEGTTMGRKLNRSTPPSSPVSVNTNKKIGSGNKNVIDRAKRAVSQVHETMESLNNPTNNEFMNEMEEPSTPNKNYGGQHKSWSQNIVSRRKRILEQRSPKNANIDREGINHNHEDDVAGKEEDCPDDEMMGKLQTMKPSPADQQCFVGNETMDYLVCEEEDHNDFNTGVKSELQEELPMNGSRSQMPGEDFDDQYPEQIDQTSSGLSYESSVNWDALAYSMSENFSVNEYGGDATPEFAEADSTSKIIAVPVVTDTTASLTSMQPVAKKVPTSICAIPSDEEDSLPFSKNISIPAKVPDNFRSKVPPSPESHASTYQNRYVSHKSLSVQVNEDDQLPCPTTTGPKTPWGNETKDRITIIKMRHDEEIEKIRKAREATCGGLTSPSMARTQSEEENVAPNSTNVQNRLQERIVSMKKQHDEDIQKVHVEMSGPMDMMSPRRKGAAELEVQNRIDLMKEQHKQNMDRMRKALANMKNENANGSLHKNRGISPITMKDPNEKHIAECVGLWNLNAKRFEKAKNLIASTKNELSNTNEKTDNDRQTPERPIHFNFDSGTSEKTRSAKMSNKDLLMMNEELEEG